jgi:Zn-dependent protease with chaperone function
MGVGEVPRGLRCPSCGSALEPTGEPVAEGEGHRLRCPRCQEFFRARRRVSNGDHEAVSDPPHRPREPRPVGDLSLRLRSMAVRTIARLYPVGVVAGAAIMLPLGGFVPVIRGWLGDEVEDWGGVVEALGGVRVVNETRDPDADFGPVLVRLDAPTLFQEVNAVARRLGVKPPDQVRLAYLPCCGVVAWRRTRILLLGLPLLQVLTQAELRAVLAHELAHLKRGDVAHSAGASRFVQCLGQAVERSNGRLRGPLGLWAKLCWSLGQRFETPIARGQEARADRTAASIAGGDAAASALVKVAMVQPLFREVLDRHNPDREDLPNIYAFFRSFWRRLPNEVREAMRLGVLVNGTAPDDSPHPPLPDRLSVALTFPSPPEPPSDRAPASTMIGDLEAFEQLLHNRLFGNLPLEPNVFHRAGR